jgi:hypothetical protein
MKKNNKASAVETMLGQGMTVSEIRDRITVSASYIYTIQKKLAEKAEAASEPAEENVETTKAQGDTSIDAVLAQRGSRYGAFVSHAKITQAYKTLMFCQLEELDKRLSSDQQEALDMIFHKIGRILNGDPNYADSWIDIAGYAQLVADRLEGKIR